MIDLDVINASLLSSRLFSALPGELGLKVTARLQMIAVHWRSCHCFLKIKLSSREGNSLGKFISPEYANQLFLVFLRDFLSPLTHITCLRISPFI